MGQIGETNVGEMLESIKKVMAERPEPAADADAAPVLELTEAMGGDAGETDDAPLLGEAARRSMQDSFAALAAVSAPGAHPMIVRSGETSLEQLTRDLLRPMLAEWLDKNLPPMVDELVRSEIERIVRRK